jgi:ABC-type transport system involved in cytochrome bd biosynthesis fused ATPase/permease subunit
VIHSITELMKGRTVLMVSHSLELLDIMDVVYVIERGQLRNVNDFGGVDAYRDILLNEQLHSRKR